ncbi:MAG TPA: Rne/Rng family ribonuclease [Defluviitoga sp.]|nr:Rne/Rng family ribonuclease [Defluviitoga sp.]HOP25053.1 Rne/Rng family ribonuclease [Defluviitoga sp.]HPZ29205.1 Rne/Rng family ribonuclease [Defluviitoga sp.]HQD63112.1 Rne/Rng family ribonuclease [Defluviitoga sp.]
MNEEKIMIFSKILEEIRIAILEDNKLTEIFFEDFETDTNTGKIFVGKIENVVPSLEAFFVNIGTGKNGFLRFRDTIGKAENYKVGDKVMVQVKKDGSSRKGPQLSMYISIPGKYLVYLPYSSDNIGISKKITRQYERQRLREIAKKLLKKGEGIIFRTNSEGMEEEELASELENLRQIFQNIQEKYEAANKPQILFEETDFMEYILRERLDSNTKKIIVDNKQIYRKLKRLLKTFKFKPILEFVRGDSFKEYGVYNQMNEIFNKKVVLENGGIITIDRAEALTVIDVDSASNLEGKNVEETSYITNLEAAKEIVRQLRLRNIGGMIVVDFIDMKDPMHRKEVIEVIKEESQKDKSKLTVVGFTNLGLLELIRKRTTPALDSVVYFPCPVCHGTGKIVSPSIVFGKLMKEIESSIKEIKRDQIKAIEISAFHNLSGYLTPALKEEMEKKLNVKVDFLFNWHDPNSYNIKYRI